MNISSEAMLKVIEFWKRSALNKELFSRNLVPLIDFKSKEIIDLVGPRRSGKSSILKLIIKKLQLKDNFLYINFEDPFFIEHNDPDIIEDLIAVQKEYFGQSLKYLFLDEIQEINNWEKALRKLRDGTDYKIFITGSSSKLLSKELSSMLTGRHLSYSVFPLSFNEFLTFKKVILKNSKDLILKDHKLKRLFEEYLQYGGFPEIVKTKNLELLKTYFFDILEKDIIARYQIRDKSTLEKLALYLITNSTKTITIESIKKLFNISFDTVSSYLKYFTDSFLIFDVSEYSFSLKKQYKSQKKIYAVDTGFAKSISFRFSEDRGRILENAVFLELKSRGETIYYYKTAKNGEIDFLLDKKDEKKELIQVSWSLMDEDTRNREVKSLFLAMQELGLNNGLILTNSETEIIKEGAMTIFVRPVYTWMLEKQG